MQLSVHITKHICLIIAKLRKLLPTCKSLLNPQLDIHFVSIDQWDNQL